MMKRKMNWDDEGQVLVQVALGLVVLLLVVGLAIDGGNVYAQRRAMQNAADAGALAGAREICFGEPANAETAAMIYAIDHNLADEAEVVIDGNTVTVSTTKHAATYLFRLVAVESVDVSAVAEAACGPADSACGLWPLAYHVDDWEKIELNELFYVWNDNRANDIDCEECKCEVYVDESEYGEQFRGYIDVAQKNVISGEERGWLLFPDIDPGSGYDDPHGCGGNCGAQTKCWIEHDYTGEVAFNNEGYICLPGNPGVIDKAKQVVTPRAGDRVNILLWNGECDPGESVEGDCPGTPYRIEDFGCVEIGPATTIDVYEKEDEESSKKPKACMQNIKIILAYKRDDCEAPCGSTSGGPVTPGGVGAVSLTK